MKNNISSLKYHRMKSFLFHILFASTLLWNSNRWPLPVCHQSTVSRRDSICIYFFSWLIHFFELERHFEGQDYWLKFFSWRSVYLISSIRYQFDPDILYDVHLIDFYIFSSFRNKIGIFCVIMRRSLALKYYFGFKIFFFGIDKWKCIESFLKQLNS